MLQERSNDPFFIVIGGMIVKRVLKRGVLHVVSAAVAILCVIGCVRPAFSEAPAIRVAEDGTLVYATDELGNRIPDFSHCGYSGANRDIPDLPVAIRVGPGESDDGPRIQAAIDRVGKLPPNEHGFRGAVLLMPGQFEVAGQLRISQSGIVIRGSGAGPNGTTIVATGTDRRPLIRICGTDEIQLDHEMRHQVVDDYVPVGATKLKLDSTAGLRVGDTVLVVRPSTAAWIKALKADTFPIVWKPGTRDIRWDRVVTAIDANSVTVDAPITTAIERQYGGAVVHRYEWPGRLSQVGVEDVRLESSYAGDHPHDEDHAWFGVVMENAQNAWVRRVELRHFAGGAVALWESTKWVTIDDCIAAAPISEIGGQRRRAFFTSGQLTLFLRCWSEDGQRDFAIGHCAAGPNAFVNCYAAQALGDSGPIESWASGVLYDNVRIDGAGLNLTNRWNAPPSAGWSAANCVLWQCRASTMDVSRPPTANNWAIGPWAHYSGDGTFDSPSDFVRPLSLYHSQLRERRGAAAAPIEIGMVEPIGATNPTVAAAREFAARSDRPARQLVETIRARIDQPPGREMQTERGEISERSVPSVDVGPQVSAQESSDRPPVSPIPDTRREFADSHTAVGRLAVQNGWLIADGNVITGGAVRQPFWQGTTRPDEAQAFAPAITRFVPGRVGTGFTDDLEIVASRMQANHIAVFDHHYGLWYDRRRDDHTMGRQADGDVVAPFFEQPFARSGQGRAWDGLSKYDLTKFNAWYWQRLRDFAQLCDERDLVLVHQHYFQHNVLEAGAHWADCPWRPANNVNDTGLPEPPPYVGDKRIFLAEQFYDVSDPRRRALHRGFIRQCLENFRDRRNVIHMTSAEYSGPLEFVQFWLDTIVEWQREQGVDTIIGLSAPKDVQDAILADPQRGPHVDVIDIRYWAYTAGDQLYAPSGGQHLAPRQHLRPTRQKPGGPAAIVKAIREYRTRYPDKAVTYYADMHCPSGRDGWAVLIGGGSIPNVTLPDQLARVAPHFHPVDGVVSGSGQWCLAGSEGDYLIYTERVDDSVTLTLPARGAAYRAHWIDRVTGGITASDNLVASGPVPLAAKTNVLWVEHIRGD